MLKCRNIIVRTYIIELNDDFLEVLITRKRNKSDQKDSKHHLKVLILFFAVSIWWNWKVQENFLLWRQWINPLCSTVIRSGCQRNFTASVYWAFSILNFLLLHSNPWWPLALHSKHMTSHFPSYIGVFGIFSQTLYMKTN